jgi:hypothetical protein
VNITDKKYFRDEEGTDFSEKQRINPVVSVLNYKY